jgi:hypothetical protein
LVFVKEFKSPQLCSFFGFITLTCVLAAFL